jgi:hypothetical protein
VEQREGPHAVQTIGPAAIQALEPDTASLLWTGTTLV